VSSNNYKFKFKVSILFRISIFSVAKSPVFAHLSSSLHGLSTIRAYQAQTQFEQMFDAVQNIHSSTNFTQIVANRWLTTTIQFIAFIYFTIVTLSFTFAATGEQIKALCKR